MTALDVRNLHKRYGEHVAVDDVSFTVEEGEIFGIIGPNGAGKTTTVESIAGLRTPDSGSISVLGLDPVTDRAEVRERLGVQLQESSFPDAITVAEALDLYSSFYRDPADWRELMELLGLTEKRRTRYKALSGGQKQRLSIALALVGNPEVAILDELTTGLDPQARRDTWSLVERVRDTGVTILLVTHFMDEAERLCDRLAVVASGRVVASGTPAELVAAHSGGVTVTFTAAGADVGFLEVVPGVRKVEVVGDRVSVHGGPTAPPHVGKALVDRGIAPADMNIEKASLEDVYLRLVDGEAAS
jgi:ABC-2 type transport system ATP-binding protein